MFNHLKFKKRSRFSAQEKEKKKKKHSKALVP
jgi:hypothetical protein